MGLKTAIRQAQQRVRIWINDPGLPNLTQEHLERHSQLQPERATFEDRAFELAEYLSKSPEEVKFLYEEYHQNKRLKKDKSALDLSTDDKVLAHYRDDIEMHLTKKMLAYTRFGAALKVLRYVNAYFPKNRRQEIKVLDYGCGVADYALAFANQGYHPVLCDIEGSHLDFAEWRFRRRGLAYDSIPVTNDNLYPDFGTIHIIIAGEVLEHVRDPLQVVQKFDQAMPKGAFFWSSGFPDDEREVGGTHLQEAADLRLDTLNYLRSHFKKNRDVKHLYRK
jgi:2-polyprenyl-3-methyl-5-hydroxy-6-metoxy-1,4-benzoquinol methylase